LSRWHQLNNVYPEVCSITEDILRDDILWGFLYFLLLDRLQRLENALEFVWGAENLAQLRTGSAGASEYSQSTQGSPSLFLLSFIVHVDYIYL
jgi:hypothetical protein